MKNLLAFLLILCTALSVFSGCSMFKAPPSIDISDKTTLSVSTEIKTVKISDKTIIDHITNNINSLSLERSEEGEEEEKAEFLLTWYENGRKNDEVEIIHSDRIKYKGVFYDVKEELNDIGMRIDIGVDLDYIRDRLYAYREKPADSELEFWITDSTSGFDFSNHKENYGWFGAREFYGLGYSEYDTEYVSYLIASYPDASDGGSYVTTITVTDPELIIMNGLTASSGVEEWNRALVAIGFGEYVDVKTNSSLREYDYKWTSEDNETTVHLHKYEGKYEWRIRAETSNREGIIY